MKKALVIGSGISGMTCAIECAKLGCEVTLASPYVPERAQSVMAAGGINAALNTKGEKDSVACHVEDTLKAGAYIAGEKSVAGLCAAAPRIVEWLEAIGTVFTRDENGDIDLRAFGGQTHKRTAYSGASTGKQIVTALAQEMLKYECRGQIARRLHLQFHSLLLKDGECYGALFYHETRRRLETIYADAVVMATGGQNGVFGKTTGSLLCDGYAAGQLFRQGAKLKNLEFIQYHPTTIETPQKKMLVSEAARGEGGRLYYLDGDKRVYFMEDKYGPKGNLMSRDIVSKEIYDAPGQVWLDIAFLGGELIERRLSEIRELCLRYAGIDVTREAIPVSPSVHFFMGGLRVDTDHRTSLKHVYAVGECASMYHGANRLGGNSLLAAIYGGAVAARALAAAPCEKGVPDFSAYIADQEDALKKILASESLFPAVYVKQELAKIMNDDLGITRSGDKLEQGLESVNHYLSVSDRLSFDSHVSPYQAYSLKGMLILAKAILTCARSRRETRGSHIRLDYPERAPEYQRATVISYDGGNYTTALEKEE